MGHRLLCLTAWTIAVGVLTGSLSGSDCQCTGSTRPVQLVGNWNKTYINFHFLPSNTSDTNCQWIISSKTIARLQLRAVTFKLRSDNGSCVDNFTVYDGNSSHARILLSTCSPPSFPINSSGREVLLSFTAGNNATSDIGFLIEYESFWSTDRCNSVVLFSVSRDPQYLEYPANDSSTSNSTSPRNASCGWLFQASSPDYIINIDIRTYLLDTSRFYIEVFDSPFEVNLLARLRGGPTQQQLFSSGQYLYISLLNSGYIDVKRLNLTSQEVQRSTVFPCNACSCRGSLTASHLHKYYLRYPADQTRYPNNVDCYWHLTSASDYVIHVTFLYIDVETSPRCSNDYVQVFDGLGSPSNSLSAVCGGRHEFYSSGQIVYIKFHSDSSITGQGFLLSYEAIRSSEVMQDIGGRCLRRIVTKTATSTHILWCTLLTPPLMLSKELHFILYIKTFLYMIVISNADCDWLLQAPLSDYVVYVNFTFVDIEESGSYCTSDYVQVFDGSSSSSDSLGKLCGSILHDFYSSGQSMYIKFHSDSSIIKGGFRLTYQAVYRWNVPTTTGGVCLRGVTKTVSYTSQSLGYPLGRNTYDNNVNCEWLLQASNENYVVYVNFTFVDIEGSSSSCPSDYVQLFDGSSSSALSLGKLCGSKSRDFYSSGQSVFIMFHSDGSVTRGGFRLNYYEVFSWSVPTKPASGCSRNTQMPTALLSSVETLQYPTNYLNYPENADCGWLLKTNDDDYVVHVTFTYVNTEYSYTCSFDYIEIFDGSSEYANSLGTLCGTTSRDFYSSGQSVFIKFHSDGSGSGGGFRLTYQAVASWEVPKADEVSPAVIAGAVVGSVVFLIAVIVVIVSFRRRQLQQSARNRPINTTNNQYIAYFYPGNGSAPNVGVPSVGSGPPHVMSGTPHVPPSVIVGPHSLSSGPPPYHLVNGPVSNVGSGPSHVTSGTPHVPPSVIVGPHSFSSEPPSYHLVSQSTGGSYPTTDVSAVHYMNSPLQQNSQQPMTRGPSSGEPLANQDKNSQEKPSIRL
ncbi:cubilin-like isoform X2 [Pomacea canaliculata]|uniref:cubilin-like isoform X2 n=1 Tax=Pomacea canaliculata TaxID=400727 RepID=UPI000D72663B|nr:cubilin-like isoform X2 [Pomacea canaliculata]